MSLTLQRRRSERAELAKHRRWLGSPVNVPQALLAVPRRSLTVPLARGFGRYSPDDLGDAEWTATASVLARMGLSLQELPG